MKNKAFTLIELVISILIISIIVVGVSTLLIKISKNIQDGNIKNEIYFSLKEFHNDSYLFSYSSWKVLTWALLLYSSSWWYLIWGYEDINWWMNYKLSTDNDRYKKKYFWYFRIQANTLSWIINGNLNYSNTYFNDGVVYSKLLLNDFKVESYNSGTIFNIDLYILKKYQTEFEWMDLKSIFIPKEDILKVNYNF